MVLVCSKAVDHLIPFKLSMARIALTREDGSNQKLADLLPDLECVELPCIQFGPGSDYNLLTKELTTYDIIAISSPQGASVFLTVWNEAGRPPIKVASVGRGTSKALQKGGVTPVFEPTDATAKVLAEEFPTTFGSRVLYPTSAIAEDTLQSALEKRGFEVKRLNTYETIPATFTPEMIELGKSIDIVTFASPSAVKTWASTIGTSAIAVVIGPTSRKAAETVGFMNIVCPEGSKGIEAWALLIRETANKLSSSSSTTTTTTTV